MASTERFQVNATSWTQVTQGEANVGIQLTGTSQIMVHIGTSDPDMDAAGIIIGRQTDLTPSEFTASGLPQDANVYVKAHGTDTAVDLVVMKY
jgi:hypothetical protein